MFKKFLNLFLFVVLGLGVLTVGCSSSKEEGTLIVGLQSGYPPYEYVDETGHVVGFDVDVAQKIADLAGKKLVIQEMGFDALIVALKSHKIDLIMSGMSITEVRLKEIDMVPYFYGDKLTELQLLFWQTDGMAIENLKGKTVVVQSGTFQEEILHHYADVQPKSLENIQELVIDIKYGKSQAALVDPAIGNDLKYKYPELHSVVLPLLPHEQILGSGIGIAKDNIKLKDAVEKTVEQLKENGQLDELQKKWFHG